MVPALRIACRRAPRTERGVVLFIALIVLVAMALAGIAMVRSVDTTLGIAGNLSFQQGAVQASDRGVAAAHAYLASAPVVPPCTVPLQCDDPANGYFSSFAEDPATGWFDPANWGTAVDVFPGGATDAAGNRIRFLIHRLCMISGTYNAIGQQCALHVGASGTAEGGTLLVGAYQFEGAPRVYFRITTRVDGPRNSVSITQTHVIADAT